MAFKIVLSDPKTRKAYQKEADEAASGLVGKKLEEAVKGEFLGLTGYELQLTGGSDKEGFPMRRDMEGIGRKRILLASGPGFQPLLKGQRKRKSIRGNTISNQISQINVKVVKHGEKTIEELLGVKPKEKPKEETSE
ncbi:MAG TPA: 30S ribosomal protein S6e, partial [archaeon]|nr:30S ribosomal protein S6e [archaeon]